MTRAVSTVLDVAVCLVLVSAAALIVVNAGPQPDVERPTVDHDAATAETLATTTATVRYSLRGDRDVAHEHRPASDERVRQGTLATLLADAANRNFAVGGRQVTDATGFTAAVEEAVRPLLDGRTRIAAVWEPYPDAVVRGHVAVGTSPPSDGTVHVATLSVPSGVPHAREPARRAASEGYGAVASEVATRVVDGLFPTRRTEVALDGGAADDYLLKERFRTVGRASGTDVTLADGVGPAKTSLAAALATRIESDLRTRYDDPTTAARAVRTGRVTIVVRRWS